MTTEAQTVSESEFIPVPATLEEAGEVVEHAPAADEPEVTNKLDGSLKLKTTKREKDPPLEKGDTKRTASKPFQEMQSADDLNLKEYISSLGAGETVRLDLYRKEPRKIVINGKEHNTAGFLTNYHELVDNMEQRIKEEWGGGLYTVRVNAPNAKGSMSYVKSRDVRIEGEPVLRGELAVPQPQQKDSTGEKLVASAIDVLKDQGKRSGPDPTMVMLLEQQREESRRADERHKGELARRDTELAQLRAEFRDQASRPQIADTFKDKMLGSLMDGETARITALRTQHDAELRQVKEGHTQELARLHDRYDREIDRASRQHDREVATAAEGHKRELDMLRQSKDNEIAALKMSADTQREIHKSEKSRMEKELDRQADELKDLRAKKDKTVIEQIKEMKVLKDAIGDEESEPEGIGQKLVEAAPMLIDQLGNAINRVRAPAQQAQQAQQVAQQQARARPVVVQAPNGEKFVQHNGKLIPVKKKGQIMAVPAGDGGETKQVEIPDIDPAKVEFAVNYLERAFASAQEPDTVAISIKPHIPEEILTAISTLGGIDPFMVRVAKLPGSSPLASQAGKNWVRKVGKALVGE